MAGKKSNELVIVRMSAGTFLCVMGDGQLEDALNLSNIAPGSEISTPHFEKYLEERNMGTLISPKLSPVTDYLEIPLSAIQQGEWADAQGRFKLAQATAKAVNENDVFRRLYAKKQ